MKTKIISLILPFPLCLILCACDVGPNAPASVIEDAGDAEEHIYTGNGSAWCSTLFEHPATRYNNNLALVAAEMSEAAEDMTGDGIKKLYSSYDIYADAIGCYGPDGDILSNQTFGGGAFSIGQDTLTINGINTTILVITALAPIPVLTDREISRKLERKGAQKHGTEKDKKGNATTSVR